MKARSSCSLMLLVAVLAFSWLMPGCGWFGMRSSKVRLNNAPEVPAAEGVVTLKEARNGNTKIDLKVKHLASPDKIAANANTYVVWVRSLTGDQTPINVGSLNVNENLEGKLETTTPLQSFELFVTPESNPAAVVPTGSKVLRTTVRKEQYTTSR